MAAAAGGAGGAPDRADLAHRVRAVERRLDELEAASLERSAEVRALVDGLPAAVSRRALVAATVDDLRRAPGRAGLALGAIRRALGRARRPPR